MQASHKMAEQMYKAAAPKTEAGTPPEGEAKSEEKKDEKKDEKVVDAEFEESEDK
jgi:hypothetical protein